VKTCVVYWYKTESGEILGAVEGGEGDSDQVSNVVARRFEGFDKSFLLGMNLLPTKKDAEEFLERLEGRLAELERDKASYLETVNARIRKSKNLIQSLREKIKSF
jgi:hypothetical protein